MATRELDQVQDREAEGGMPLLFQGEGPGHDEVGGVRVQGQAGLARLKFLGPHRVVGVEQAAERRRKAGNAGDMGVAVAGQHRRAVSVGSVPVGPEALIVVGPDQGPGVGQKDPPLQLQGDAAAGGLGHLRSEDVVHPVKPVGRVHGQPGPERLRLTIPQAGQVTEPLVLKEGQQRGKAGLVGMGVGYQGQPFHSLSISH